MARRTSLYEEHQHLGGRLIDFGGWDLPVQYSGVMDEHLACREAAGLFDVSHMGEVHVEGPGADRFLDHLVTNHVAKLAVGQALYTVMCQSDGGIVDDLVVYRREKEKFLLVINASRTEKDFQHIQSVWNDYGRGELKITNESDYYSQIAIQGRQAAKILEKITQTPLAEIKTYWFAEGQVLDAVPAIIARTGYTGEDGFELYVPWDQGPTVWRALIAAGQPLGLKPCGLGARDTLRLEMKYPLYGHELNEQIHPLDAGLQWVVKWDKGDFIGRPYLLKAKEAGLRRKLIGFRLLGKNIPRQGYSLYDQAGHTLVGETTSGTQSPSLQWPIGLGYVDIAHSGIGTAITVDIRGNKIPAEIVATPFYKKPYSA